MCVWASATCTYNWYLCSVHGMAEVISHWFKKKDLFWQYFFISKPQFRYIFLDVPCFLFRSCFVVVILSVLSRLVRSIHNDPDSKVHGANMGPIWGRQDPGGPHVGPMNLAIWGYKSGLFHRFKGNHSCPWVSEVIVIKIINIGRCLTTIK